MPPSPANDIGHALSDRFWQGRNIERLDDRHWFG